MKKTIITLIFGMYAFSAFSQGPNIYSVFVNYVNEDFKFPLIGFVNMAKGDHKGLQLGFLNTNTGNFSGLQTGFINTTTGDLKGMQLGFVNTTAGNLNTGQIGFVNTGMKEVRGAQIGFVNTGVKEIRGAQIGFVNTTMKRIDGAQIGFVNVAKQKLKGLQLGFINYTDSIESGIPIGFLSIIKQGGYMAVEYSFSEFYPLTVGFKTGIEKFYTTVFWAYRPSRFTWNNFASGLGVGSLVPIKNSFFFNPELNFLNSLGKNNSVQSTSFVSFFGYDFDKRFSITAGPSVTWSRNYGDGDLSKPLFKIVNYEINDNHNIVVGARFAVRYRF